HLLDEPHPIHEELDIRRTVREEDLVRDLGDRVFTHRCVLLSSRRGVGSSIAGEGERRPSSRLVDRLNALTLPLRFTRSTRPAPLHPAHVLDVRAGSAWPRRTPAIASVPAHRGSTRHG